MPRYGSNEERFWKFTRKVGDCLLWQGSKTWNGYGQFRWHHLDGRTSNIVAHKAAWILGIDIVAAGKCVLHKCDNRSCVNVDHLFIGTAADNSEDMRLKDRQPKFRLSKEKVFEIKSLLGQGVSGASIARQFGVSPSMICAIKKERSWRHV